MRKKYQAFLDWDPEFYSKVFNMAHKLSPSCHDRREDLISHAEMALIQKYGPSIPETEDQPYVYRVVFFQMQHALAHSLGHSGSAQMHRCSPEDARNMVFPVLDNRAAPEPVGSVEEVLGLALSGRTKRIVELKLQGYTRQEIADILGINYSTVARDLRKLEKEYDELQD